MAVSAQRLRPNSDRQCHYSGCRWWSRRRRRHPFSLTNTAATSCQFTTSVIMSTYQCKKHYCRTTTCMIKNASMQRATIPTQPQFGGKLKFLITSNRTVIGRVFREPSLYRTKLGGGNNISHCWHRLPRDDQMIPTKCNILRHTASISDHISI